MKNFFWILCSVTLLVQSCYDDSELNARIDALEEAMYQKSINALKVSVKSLEKVDAEVEATLAALEASDADNDSQIAALKRIDSDLDDNIAALKALADGNNKGAKAWAESTVATIRQYNVLVETLYELHGLLSKEMAAADKEIKENYLSLSAALSSTESSVRSWVTSVMENYASDKELQELAATLGSEIESLDKRLTALEQKISELEEILGKLPGGGQDLSGNSSANCYIVSAPGTYKFRTAKGNSKDPVGFVASAEVLWESFGTEETPSVGDLISKVSYYENYIYFSTPDPFKEGNAVIAAKDQDDNVLWSWHIWLTDKPEDQVYNYGAGTMMDRNLGATSATPGDAGALGLLYQWGRKDPFLGGSAIYADIVAASTLTWPDAVKSESSTGTIEYTTGHPTTFITFNENNYDWHYADNASVDDTRWQSEKTVYDPCPAGYRVPDGSDNGVWSNAFLWSGGFNQGSFESVNAGFNFGAGVSTYKLTSSALTCWYPETGYMRYDTGLLFEVGYHGSYWSCSPWAYAAHIFGVYSDGGVYPSNVTFLRRAGGCPVRCLKENSSAPYVPEVAAVPETTICNYSGGAFSFSYDIKDLREEIEVAASSDCDWITDVKHEGNVVSFNVSLNNTGFSRTGHVRLAYGKVVHEYVVCQSDILSSAEDLSSSGASNCYVISESGLYKLRAVKGNSSESAGSVASAVVLWESFGTNEVPTVGALIEGVTYLDNYMYFVIPDTFREGNAVIAARDASGKILWSWHIWLTDKPQDQVYNNNAGTMMDRNLGATSATPGDVGSLGLLYQWGRKDPFLSGSSISSSTPAKSTITWPSAVSSDSSNGTISYATEHPTTFITHNIYNYDWYYTGNDETGNTRWQSEKTIYDPCPVGYRVPDGGAEGLWSRTFGSSSYFYGYFDSTTKGFDFSNKEMNEYLLTSDVGCWYPAAGCLSSGNGSLYSVGNDGDYWSCSPSGTYAYSLGFHNNGYVGPSYNFFNRADGFSVRCLRE